MIKEEEVYVCEMTYFDSVYCSSQTNKSAVERKSRYVQDGGLRRKTRRGMARLCWYVVKQMKNTWAELIARKLKVGKVQRREETMIGAPGKGELCNLLVECTSEMKQFVRNNLQRGAMWRRRAAEE